MKRLLCLFWAFVIATGMVLGLPVGSALADPNDPAIPTPPPPVIVIDEPPAQAPPAPVPAPKPEPVQVPATVVPQPPPAQPEPAPAPQAPVTIEPPAPPVRTPVQPTVPASPPSQPTAQAPAPATSAPPLPPASEAPAPSRTPQPKAPAPESKPQESLPSAPSQTERPSTEPDQTPPSEESSTPGSEPNEESTEPSGSAPSEESPSTGSPSGSSVTEEGTTVPDTPHRQPPALAEDTEPVKIEQPSAIQPQEGATVEKTALEEEQPVSPQEASPTTIDEVTEALQTLGSTRDQNSGDNRDNDRDRDRDRDNDRDRDHDHDRDKPRPPKDPDPKGWQCKDKRGPSWCQWNDWSYDDHGRPVFHNGYDFDLKFVYVDYNTGQRVEVVVRARTSQPINAPRPGDYSFLVFGVSNPNFALNVGMGTFRSGGHCSNRCAPPPRPTINFDLRINVWSGRTLYPHYVPVYDCGCGPYQRIDNRDYYRYYFGGTREVIGYWEGPPQQQGSYFVPVQQRPTPAAPAYVPVTPENLGEVLGEGEPLGGDPSQALSLSPPASDARTQVWGVVGGTALLLLVIGGAAYGVSRRLNREA